MTVCLLPMSTTTHKQRMKKEMKDMKKKLQSAATEPIDICNYAEYGYSSYSTVLEERLMKSSTFTLQSVDWDANREFGTMLAFISKHIACRLKLLNEGDGEWFVKFLENIVITYYWLQRCQSGNDVLYTALTSYKLFTGKSYTTSICARVENLFGNGQVQAGDFGDLLQGLRSAFDTVEGISENPLLKRITSLYSYLLVQGFLSHFGLELNDEDYSRMEQKALLAQYSSKKGLWMNIFDTTLFVCERVHEWKRTGQLSAFLHTGGEYDAWGQEADRLLALGPFTSNLEAHGTTYFSFVSDLNAAVEKGEAYAKFSKKAGGYDVVALKRKLMALQLMKNVEITRRSAQKERRAPFGVLVHGASSVAKSTFTKMLYYYYGSLHGLATDDHYRYVRSPTDEYWSNFDSSKWCIQLDDIAFLLPSKAAEVDPTLAEMLNVVNNVPFVPPQAAIEDKGKTPVLARLVVATSNAKDLNAQEYF